MKVKEKTDLKGGTIDEMTIFLQIQKTTKKLLEQNKLIIADNQEMKTFLKQNFDLGARMANQTELKQEALKFKKKLNQSASKLFNKRNQ